MVKAKSREMGNHHKPESVGAGFDSQGGHHSSLYPARKSFEPSFDALNWIARKQSLANYRVRPSRDGQVGTANACFRLTAAVQVLIASDCTHLKTACQLPKLKPKTGHRSQPTGSSRSFQMRMGTD